MQLRLNWTRFMLLWTLTTRWPTAASNSFPGQMKTIMSTSEVRIPDVRQMSEESEEGKRSIITRRDVWPGKDQEKLKFPPLACHQCNAVFSDNQPRYVKIEIFSQIWHRPAWDVSRIRLSSWAKQIGERWLCYYQLGQYWIRYIIKP